MGVPMNEQRNKKMFYFGQKVDPLKEDWDALSRRLQHLYATAQSALRMDLLAPIARQINVLQRNAPNKKIYRSILKFVEQIESELDNYIERTR